MATTSKEVQVLGADGTVTTEPIDANIFGTGTVAARPASGTAVGDIYIVDDAGLLRFDIWDGSTWVQATVQGPAGGTVADRVAAWTGTGGDQIKNTPVGVDGSGNLTGVGTVNGVTIEGHATRHLPGGADALTVGTPTAVLVGAAAAAGSANSFTRSDHQHGITAGVPVSVGTANAAGAASSVARSNHVHNHGTQTVETHHALVASTAAGFQPRSNRAATTNPGVGNDSSQGYAVGSYWINVTLDCAFICVDASVGAAIWKLFVQSGTPMSLWFSFGGNAVTEVGDFNTVSVGSNSSINISLFFPIDFASLVSLDVIGIPSSSFTNQDIDLTSDYGAAGELYNNHQGSNTTGLYSGTINQLFTLSEASLFASAAAGDYAGIMINHNSIGASIRYLGCRLRYIRS